uniref:Uncharacterized protein n=1 Tax=Hemiselmis tepida TaxID=464990 RepID=A0A7S0WAU8_9CRYP
MTIDRFVLLPVTPPAESVEVAPPPDVPAAREGATLAQLPGLSDVSGAAMGESDVSLDLRMMSMKRGAFKGDAEASGTGENWHEHEEDEETGLTTNAGSMAFSAQDEEGGEVTLQAPASSFLSLKRSAKK